MAGGMQRQEQLKKSLTKGGTGFNYFLVFTSIVEKVIGNSPSFDIVNLKVLSVA